VRCASFFAVPVSKFNQRHHATATVGSKTVVKNCGQKLWSKTVVKLWSKTVGATDHLPVFARIVRPVVLRPAKQVVLHLNAQPKDFRLKNGEQTAELETYQDALSQLGAAYTSTITALQQQASAGATSATSAVQQAHEQLLAALRHAVNASFGYKGLGWQVLPVVDSGTRRCCRGQEAGLPALQELRACSRLGCI
jgi:hypothetical protein